MRLTLNILMELCHHESLVRQAYLDNAKPPVWTWGIGLATTGGHNAKQYKGKPQPLQKCIDEFVKSLGPYVRAVDRAFAGYDLTEAQYGASLSFHFNSGGIEYAQWVEDFKNGDIFSAERHLGVTSWKKPAGRRKAERELFFEGEWSNNGTMIEYTEVTSYFTPKWSSAKKINVQKELSVAFAKYYGKSSHSGPGASIPAGSDPIAPKKKKRYPVAIIIDLLRRIFKR